MFDRLFHHTRGLLAAAALIAVAACGGSDPAPAGGGSQPAAAAVARLEVQPPGGLIVGTAERRAVTVKAFDAQGNEVAVAASDVEFASSDPAGIAVARTGAGHTLGAVVPLGSALVTARVGTVVSAPAAFYAAEPAAGALLVDDAQLRTAPEPVGTDAPGGLGDRYRVTLSGVGTPAAGTLVLARGAAPLGGRIVSASPNAATPADTDVVLELVAPAELFANLRLQLRFTPEQTSAMFVPAPSTTLLGSRRAPHAAADGGRVVALGLDGAGCSGEAPALSALSGEAKVKVDPSLAFDADLDIAGGAVRKARFVADGTLVASGKAVLNLGATVTGSVTCKEQLGVIPIPITGPLTPIIAPIVPIDAKISLGAQIQVNLFSFGADIKAKATTSFGFDWDDSRPAGDRMRGIQTLAMDDPEFNRNISFPTDLSVRVKGTAFVGLSSGLALGGKAARLEVVEVSAGPEFEARFAGIVDAAADEVYTTEYELRARASIGPGKYITKALELLFGSTKALDFNAKVEKSIAKSPKSKAVSTEKSLYGPGEVVRFEIDLDPAKVNFPLVGYNVTEVRVYRLPATGFGSGDLVSSATAAEGQTHFELNWTPGETVRIAEGGRLNFHAFVVEKPLSLLTGVFPFELGPVKPRDAGTQGLIAGGGVHSIAVDRAGKVLTWGSNSGDALGRAGGGSPGTVNLPGPAKAVAAAAWYSVALLDDGRVYAWGWAANVKHAVGFGSTSVPTIDTPQLVLVDRGVRIQQIATRYTHTLMLASDGVVWGFGPSPAGQLLDTSAEGYVRMLPVTGIQAVAAGEAHSLALRSDGRVLAWGGDGDGQLGGASATTPVPGLPPIKAIAASSWASFALDENGEVWSWGNGEALGRPGDAAPARIPGLAGVRAIAAGNYTVFALRDDGTVLAWGSDAWGRTGTGQGGGVVATPTLVPGLADVLEVNGAEFHGLALTRSGAVYAWGRNDLKALNGSGDPVLSATPIPSGFVR